MISDREQAAYVSPGFRHRLTLAAWVLLASFMIGPATWSSAQEQDSPASGSKSNAARRSRGTRDPQREQAALDFVQENYPQLMEVLIYLKENNARQYWRAVNDLDRTRLKLMQARKRSPERYRLELESWKLKSEIQLLSARMAMQDSPSLREELANAVARQTDLRIAMLKREKAVVAERLSRIDQSLERLEQRRDEEVERVTKQLVQKIKRMNKSGLPASKAKPRRKKQDKSKRNEK